MIRKLNDIVNYVREKGRVPFGQVCFDLGIAPSTLYQYLKVISAEYVDISYHDGILETSLKKPKGNAESSR